MARDPQDLTIRMDAVTEGNAMEGHPGIVFRDGPGGRRAGVSAGPDVWQVIAALRGSGKAGAAAVQHAAEWLNLRPDQVRAARGYYAAHESEVDEWIRRNDEEAEAAEAAWLREQDLLA